MLGRVLVGADGWGISQARKRLGRGVLAEVFEQVAEPVGGMFTRGAWLRGWRLLAIDGFEINVPDTEKNAAEFGYAGSGDNRSVYPKVRVVALVECGTLAGADRAGAAGGDGPGGWDLPGPGGQPEDLRRPSSAPC